MMKIRLAAAAAVAGAVTLLSSGAAQAYPDPSISVTLGDAIVYGGDTISFTADAGKVTCTAWVVTFNGSSKTGSGKSFSGTFGTPKVSKTIKKPITARCTYDDAVDPAVASTSDATAVTPAVYVAGSSSTLQAATQTATASATVTLLPRGAKDDDDNGALPDTGGSNLSLLVIGGVLVVGGVGVTYAARRRHSVR